MKTEESLANLGKEERFGAAKSSSPSRSSDQGVFSKLFQKLLLDAFKKLTVGCMRISLPDGQTIEIGDRTSRHRASINVLNSNFFRRSVIFGAIGFAESYIDGEWETNDITAVVDWFVLNVNQSTVFDGSKHKHSAIDFLGVWNRFVHAIRPNTLSKSKENISEHYDLGNNFFQLFLDPTMTYSSALFQAGDESLEQAQIAKYDRLCRKLLLNRTDHVLEIGTGWGGFSIYAAQNYGCKVTSITISKEQYDFALAKVKKLGLCDRISIELKDYRHLEGRFSKIASIEMVEALGDRFVETYFEKCESLLEEDGLLGIQMIITPDCRYDVLRKSVDFIQKHIFPGSLLLSIGRVNRALEKVSRFSLYNLEDFGESYARTLLEWQDNFNAHQNEILSLGFDQRFIRKWNYYFSYCASAFTMRQISVVQAIYTRPNNLKIAEAKRL
jgi:cyclopropane-fatty-acyl-phospholipid synthase